MTRCTSVTRVLLATMLAGVVSIPGAPDRAEAQDIVDYDYENLTFRGIALDIGYLYADNVQNARTLGVRFDLGFLGPGFRLMPGVKYWSSEMARSEVNQFETRLATLTTAQGGVVPAGGFDLGVIERKDIIVSLDGHYLWATPMNLLLSTGAGVSGHFLNGAGPAVDGTFVEDLLDSVAAGFNLHVGLEYPITDRIRIHGLSRFEVLGDLNYFELGGGLTFIWGGLVEGEAR